MPGGLFLRCAGLTRRWLRREFVSCLWQEKAEFVWGPQSVTYVLLSLSQALLCVGHILYGTAIFSSQLFIMPTDAVIIVARYVASALVCRAVLVFEITGMRSSDGEVEREGEGEGEVSRGHPSVKDKGPTYTI